MRFAKSILLSALPLCALAALTLSSTAHAQGLLGQDVHLDYLFPDLGTTFENDGTQTVTAGGVTFNSFGQVFTTVTPNQSVTTFATNASFTPAAFNGTHLFEVGASPVTITGVTIDPATTIAGFDASRISFDGTNIYANFQSLTFTTQDNITLNINTTAVPEPGSVALLVGIGTVGAGFLRRRKAAK